MNLIEELLLKSQSVDNEINTLQQEAQSLQDEVKKPESVTFLSFQY